MIAGLEDISDGELWIGEKLVNYLPPRERDLSMVFQSYAMYPQMSVYDNIAFSLQVRRMPKKEIDRRVQQVAELLGLKSLLNEKGLRLPKAGIVKIRRHREIPEGYRIKSVTVSREPFGKFYAGILCEYGIREGIFITKPARNWPIPTM